MLTEMEIIHFRLHCDRPGHVALSYKMWSDDDDWLPSPSEEPIELFRLDSDGKQILPGGSPDVVQPLYESRQQYASIKANIDRMRNFLKYEEYQWWEQLFSNPSDTICGEATWFLDLLQPLQQHNNTPTSENTESPLAIAMERERRVRHVYSGKKRSSNQIVTPTKEKKRLKETGYMLAIEEDSELFLGKVTTLGNTTLTMQLFTGTLSGSWYPITSSQGRHYEKTFRKDRVKDDMIFCLTPSGKIPGKVKERLNRYF